MAKKSKQDQLDVLRKKMASADLLLKKTAHHLVFGAGKADAAIVLIGEAPGKNEDLQGLPFIGAAGKILNEMLESAGLNRDDIYITSILKYRPPGNRNPTLEEIIDHTPYLIEQIKIIAPKIIAPMGNFATRFILSGLDVKKMAGISGISQLRGDFKKIVLDGKDFSVMPLYHPAAVLYNRSLHKILKKDFSALSKNI